MEISKLQHPTKRNSSKKEEPVQVPNNMVKQEDDGTVTITKVEVKATSAGRERFGTGTIKCGKFPLDQPCLKRFSR
jgi:hypothetical protein